VFSCVFIVPAHWLHPLRQVLSSTAHSIGIMSLNPTWGMNACLYFSCVYIVLHRYWPFYSLQSYPESSARCVQTCFSNSESGRAWAALAFSVIEMDTIGKTQCAVYCEQ
jgi:hypothetical protein